MSFKAWLYAQLVADDVISEEDKNICFEHLSKIVPIKQLCFEKHLFNLNQSCVLKWGQYQFNYQV